MIRDSAFGRDGLTLQKFVDRRRCRRDAGAQRRAALVGDAGHLPPAVPWLGHRRLHRRRRPPRRADGRVGVRHRPRLLPDRRARPATTPRSTRPTPSRRMRSSRPSHPEAARPPSRSRTDRWVGPRAVLYGDATTVSTSRLAVDSVDFSERRGAAVGRRTLGADAARHQRPRASPSASASARSAPRPGLSPSFGLTDFEDLNGDGYPDVISTGNVTYTDQVGSYLDSRSVEPHLGDEPGPDDLGERRVVGRHGRHPAQHQGQHQRGGRRLRRQEPVGERFRPVVLARHLRQRRLLVDQPQRVRRVGRPVRLDLRRPGRQPDQRLRCLARAPRSSGPSPTSTATDSPTACTRRPTACSPSTTSATGSPAHAVKLGGGGFESRESATGGAGLGFSLPYAEFGGGVNLLFNYDWSTYSWRDVNGDGILDQLRRASPDSIKVRFGTGSGLLPEVDYGNLADGGGQPGHRRRRARRTSIAPRASAAASRRPPTSARSASSPATS